MSEIRKNLITGEFVLMAPERAKRPLDFVPPPKPSEVPSFSDNCPFCPGHETMTPPENFRLPATGAWSTRCIPNKFSALSPDGDLWSKFSPLRQSMAGVGLHEVIVETPRHDLTLANQTQDGMDTVVFTYFERFNAFYRDPRVQHVILFKNHGPAAGTSLQHPHSQIVGVPITPAQVRFRADDALEFFNETGGCMFCETLRDELTDDARIVTETAHFAAFIPYAALSPFHTWIFPKRHFGCFGHSTVEELADMSRILRDVLYKLHRALSNPDYNLVLRSWSPGDTRAEHLHWYVAIVPRVTKMAGFELGTGMYINPSMPEASAKFLRDAGTPE